MKFQSAGPPWYGAQCRLYGVHLECDFGTPEEARKRFYAE